MEHPATKQPARALARDALIGALRTRADAGPASAAPWPPPTYMGWARRLTLAQRLRRHTGCVNTATWSGDGTAIVSSGDDTRCVVWPATSVGGAAAAPLLEFATSHTSNVFDAKLVEPAVGRGSRVVTCARDGRVLEHTLTGVRRGGAVTRVLSHAQGRYAPVHRLSVSRANRDDVCSAAGDGVCRRYDLRAAAPCVGAFTVAGGVTDPARMELNVVAFHPDQEHVVLLAGGAPDVRLFDLRRPGPPLQRFFPREVVGASTSVRALSVTGADWSADGRDCVASYNDGVAVSFRAHGDAECSVEGAVPFVLGVARIDRRDDDDPPAAAAAALGPAGPQLGARDVRRQRRAAHAAAPDAPLTAAALAGRLAGADAPCDVGCGDVGAGAPPVAWSALPRRLGTRHCLRVYEAHRNGAYGGGRSPVCPQR